jgi:hypothetical protein
MIFKFRGLCSGTETRISKTSQQPYQITKFVEFPSLNTFEVFGDLGIPPTLEAVDWEMEGQIEKVNKVKIISGAKKK